MSNILCGITFVLMATAAILWFICSLQVGKNEFMNHVLSVIGKKLIEQDETVAVAESVTAGTIQAAMSLAKNALDFFAGGITTYNIDQKVKHLKVTRRHAERVNCVSRRVATEMAKTVARLFNSEWSIAITGYAAPVPEEGIDFLFAWVVIQYKGRVVNAQKLKIPTISPLQAQRLYKKKTLELFTKALH